MSGPDTDSRPVAQSPSRPVRLAAVGDLLLLTDPAGRAPDRQAEDIFSAVAGPLGECDAVLGNLECTLPGSGGMVPTEPRVVATEEMIRGVVRAGFNVLCLANNHTFDCLEDGFRRLRALLGELGVACFGAGENLREATSPALLTVRGVRLAFLGGADRRSGTVAFAGDDRFGVAPLETDLLAEQIRRLRAEVDHVIVSAHWGEERFDIPSPQQIAQARAFVEAGASVVVGHHPHVIQGMEVHRGAPIVYSLGNFVASEVYFTSGDAVRWDRTGRTGCMLQVEMGGGGEIVSFRQIPTFDDGKGVVLDRSGFGARRIDRCNRTLARGVTLRRYRQEALRVHTIRPALRYLRWSRLKTLRLRQVRKAFASIFRARRAE